MAQPMHQDRVMSILISLMIVGFAMMFAGLTSYVPLVIIGPDLDRAGLLLWVMLIWLVGVTVIGILALRPLFRKIFS